jgi:hypothetical protein
MTYYSFRISFNEEGISSAGISYFTMSDKHFYGLRCLGALIIIRNEI